MAMTIAVNYEQFLSHFRIAKRQGDKAQCNCPAHEDKKASLSIDLRGQKILAFCHAGCDLEDVLKAVNLTTRDLFLNDNRVEAVYQYRKADGSLSHEKVKTRFPDGSKTFHQRRIDANGNLVDDLEGVEHIPYNYPEFQKTVKCGETALYCEGEKDCRNARLLGFTATTMGGASDWKPGYAQFFKGARMVLIPDKDNAGLQLTEKMFVDITQIAKSARIVILPEGKDLSDYITAGYGRADLDKLIAESPELVKAPMIQGMMSFRQWRDSVQNQPVTDDLIQDIMPDYSSEYLLLCGRSGIGKTNLALDMACCLASGRPWFSFKVKKCKVGYLAFEGAPRKLLIRFDKLLKSYPEAEDNLSVARVMPFKLSGKGIDKLAGYMSGQNVLFIDPIRYIVPGDYTRPEFASTFISTIKTLCQKTGTVVILLHHVKKPDDRLKVKPEDLQFTVKGATDYVDAASTLLLLERGNQVRAETGQFGKGTSDDRILYFCKVKDSPTELLPLNLQFSRDTLLYKPTSTQYPEEDVNF